MNPVILESPSLRQTDSEQKLKHTPHSQNHSDILQSTYAKRKFPTKMSRDNPFIPHRGRHIKGKQIKSSLKKDRYKQDHTISSDKLGTTHIDLGSLKLVKKRLDFQRSITKPNLDSELGEENVKVADFPGVEENRMSKDNAQNDSPSNVVDFEF